MARKEEINPEVLVWARETAGLSLDEAAARVGLTTGSKSSATEKLTQFERGEKSPTRNQLLKFAATYRRPLVSFYMTPCVFEMVQNAQTGGCSNSRPSLDLSPLTPEA